jgi:hypothetical protein
LLGLLLAALLGTLSFLALFAGAVGSSGCYLGCGDPHPILGPALLAAGGLAGVAALAAGWWGLVDRRWWTAVRWFGALAVAAVVSLAIVGLLVALESDGSRADALREVETTHGALGAPASPEGRLGAVAQTTGPW